MRNNRRRPQWGHLPICLVGGGLLMACGAAPSTPERPANVNSTQPAWLQAEDPVATRMQEIATRLRAAGIRPAADHAAGFLSVRERTTVGIHIGADRCITIVALGTQGIGDLDATLYAPDGTVLAEDSEPDAHPTVQACGSGPGRAAYYSLQAYAGAGAYLWVAFEGDRTSLDRVAEIVGGRPGRAADSANENRQDARLRELREGVARRGFLPAGEPMVVQLAPSQVVRLPLAVEPARCYTVAAFGDPSVENADLKILDEAGDDVATDASAAATAALQFCADRAGDYAIEVRATTGAGSVRVAVFEGTSTRVGGSSGLWLGTRRETTVRATPLDESLRADLVRAQSAGYDGARRLLRDRFAPGEARRVELVLEGGRCHLLLATGGRGVGRVQMRVLGKEGELSRERLGDGSARIGLCAEQPERVEVILAMRTGHGELALNALWRTPGQLVARTLDDHGAVMDAIEEGEAHGWTLRGSREPREPQILSGPRAAALLRSEHGGCQRAVVVASGRGAKVAASLIREGRSESGAVGRSVVLHSCRRMHQPDPALDVRSVSGDGRAYLLVFDRSASPGVTP